MRKFNSKNLSALWCCLAFFVQAVTAQLPPNVLALQQKLDSVSGCKKLDLLIQLGSSVSPFDNLLATNYFDQAWEMTDDPMVSSDPEGRIDKGRIQNARNWSSMYAGDFLNAFKGSIALDSLAKQIRPEEDSTKIRPHFGIHARIIRGAIFSDQNQFVRSEAEFREALELTYSSDRPDKTGAILNNMGIVLMEQGKYDEAEHNFLKSDSIFTVLESDRDRAYSYMFLQDCYRNSGDWEKLKAVSFEAIELIKQHVPSRTGIVTAYAAQAFLEVGEDAKSDSLLIEATKLFENIKEPGILSEFKGILAQMHESRGEFEAAIKMKNELGTSSDSTGSALYSQKLLEFQDAYFASKNTSKASFFAKKSNWLIFGLGLLGTFFSWLYFRSKKNPPEEKVAPKLEIAWKNNEADVSNADPFVERFMAVVSDRLEEGDLSVDGISEAMRISRVQLFKKIKAATGEPPSTIIRKIRLETAEKLLVANNTTISEVAYKVGFSNPNSFSRAFKDHFGQSPKEYLQKGQG